MRSSPDGTQADRVADDSEVPFEHPQKSLLLRVDATIDALIHDIARIHSELAFSIAFEESRPPNSPAPNHGTFGTKATEELGMTLLQAASTDSARSRMLGLRDEEARKILDAAECWLKAVPSDPARRDILSFVVKLAGASSQLPTSLFIHGVSIQDSDRAPWRTGGFGDIFRGTYKDMHVVAKRLRVHTSDDAVMRSRLCRETLVWRHLDHPFVLPLVGVDADAFASNGTLDLISPWMERGTLCQYIESGDYQVDKDRYRLLLEIAEGLWYLHSEGVVHGDIHWCNVLIDEYGYAQIADFGLSMIADADPTRTVTTNGLCGAVRWTPPERFTGSWRRSVTDDVYSFACLCYSVFTEAVPFSDLTEYAVLVRVAGGGRPPRPQVEATSTQFIPDDMWALVEDCWVHVAAKRPSMTATLVRLRTISTGQAIERWEEPSSGPPVSEASKHQANAPYRPGTSEGCAADLDICQASCCCTSCTTGWTPLHWTASTGHDPVASVLLNHGTNVDDADAKGRSALHIAVVHGHEALARILLERGASPLTATSKNRWMPLHMAASQGHAGLAALLLQRGADINATSAQGWSALHVASQYDHPAVAQLLLAQHIQVDTRTVYGSTALILASMRGHTEVVRVLCPHVNLNGHDDGRRTAVSWAAAGGHTTAAQILLDAGADIHTANAAGWTPLLRAAAHGHTDMVSLLLARGADIRDTDCDNAGALHKAAAKGHTHVVSLLLEYGASIEAKTTTDWTPLHFAAYHGQPEALRRLVQSGADTSAVARNQRTPLLLATEMGHEQVTLALLERGAPGAERSLFRASSKGNAAIVWLLLAHGASVTYADEDGQTALHEAADAGDLPIAALLLEHGADVGALTNLAWTPLHAACHGAHADVAELLVTRGAGVDAVTSLGHTPLSLAAEAGSYAIVEALLAGGASGAGLALVHAAASGDEAMAELLLEHGADVMDVDADGCTALHCAATTEVALLLLTHGASVAARSVAAWTPLHCAASEGQTDLVDLLLNNGADPSAQTDEFRTPLSLAAEGGHVHVVELLLTASNGSTLISDDS